MGFWTRILGPIVLWTSPAILYCHEDASFDAVAHTSNIFDIDAVLTIQYVSCFGCHGECFGLVSCIIWICRIKVACHIDRRKNEKSGIGPTISLRAKKALSSILCGATWKSVRSTFPTILIIYPINKVQSTTYNMIKHHVHGQSQDK